MLFGNFIFNYAVKRVLAENHPLKDFEHCINRRQVKHKCTVCADVCPKKVYSGAGCRDADFGTCVNCNLCVTACPARCIASSAINASAYLKLLQSPEKTVFIASWQYQGRAHLRTDSFAALSWEFLACAGLCKKVFFVTADLPDDTPWAQAVWRKTLASLKLFFGNEEFEQRFGFLQQTPPSGDGPQTYSRRELFKKANDTLKNEISSFVPSESMMDGLLYRRLLQEVLEKCGSSGPFGWVIPMISSRCKGCGICAKLCPQDALAVHKENGQFQVLFSPLRCNACGLCGKTCIHHAVEGLGLTHINSLKPLILFDSAADGRQKP